MTFRISEIKHNSPEYKIAIVFREEILRKPLGLTYTKEQLAQEDIEHHIVCYDGEKLVGALCLRPLENGEIRMRQVAVAPEYQKKGIGKMMVEYSEEFARTKGYSMIMCHARVTAIAFYVKIGWDVLGDPFTEVGITHRRCQKILAPAEAVNQ